MSREEFIKRWSELHGGATPVGIVGGWLRLAYVAGVTLSRLRITAMAVTLMGLFFGIATAISALSPLAILFIVLSLICDGIDGPIAILSRKDSRFGAIVDSLTDRVVEVCWAIAFVRLGAPLVPVLAAALFAYVQEYLRARAGGLGVIEVGVVTICERPVRASLIFVALILFQISESGLVPESIDRNLIITCVAWVWLAMQSFAMLSVTRYAFGAMRDERSQQ